MIMTSATALQPVKESGWRRGLANLLRKENSEWWHTRRWWLQTLVWLLIVNGILAVGLWVVPIVDPEDTSDSMDNLGIFIQLMAWFPMFAVIVTAQGAIIGEKQSGTAAWIMSAPVSRSAFILAKVVAYALGFFVTIILVQGVVAYVQLSLSDGSPLALAPYLAMLALLSLYLFFYLALTLMLGAFFDARGPVLGIAIAIAIGSMLSFGNIFAGFLPWLTVLLPEAIPGILTLLVAGEPLPDVWPIPIILISVYSLIFVILAIWRFNREEF
jgi:ABC-2 type transport system permease protein